jgi:hypothetical protein
MHIRCFLNIVGYFLQQAAEWNTVGANSAEKGQIMLFSTPTIILIYFPGQNAILFSLKYLAPPPRRFQTFPEQILKNNNKAIYENLGYKTEMAEIVHGPKLQICKDFLFSTVKCTRGYLVRNWLLKSAAAHF